ncbi:MAG: NAD(P)(+) transhydrogenase (Re/Si-specific) subunit beta [SAR202 cluster bacterium]|nr:NAD(P)(+) transhydrogenase (Re/Si-specific) subunit beta [SAR202 cluster bacterium]
MNTSSFDIAFAIKVAYLVSAVLFIIGLKLLGSAATARNGNRVSAAGMLLAIVVTLLDRQIVTFPVIIAGLVVGTALGAVMARMVKMTAMPQFVAAFNGFGGAASALVAIDEFMKLAESPADIPIDIEISIVLGVIIGWITLSGSLIAFGKLQEVISTKPVQFPFQKVVSGVVAIAILAMAVVALIMDNVPLFIGLSIACLLLGVLLVIPIGGADMPVVISLLNSYSGLAAAAAGFALNNVLLIVAGSLVGASGIILTQVMTKAMNRSLLNVLFGAFGAAATGGKGAQAAGGPKAYREATPEDAAIALAYAQRAVFVPGYGLAVARAQHQIKELATMMENRGVDVKYAIHPVAGRMPGHMNVLLAEADVPYDKLYDLDQINDKFEDTDIVLVVGANDVVNPAARDNPGSPIYGMPVLNVDKAKQVIVMKRSMNPGFAGLDNDLFYKPNSVMLFGDAQASLVKLITEMKALS